MVVIVVVMNVVYNNQQTNEQRELENQEEYWESRKALNAIRKRYYATAQLRNNEVKKIRRWLDDGDNIEIGTESNGTLILLNTTGMNKNPRLFEE